VREGYPAFSAAGADMKAQGLPFYDLTGIFAEVPDDVYVDNCCHVNAAGNRIIAAAVAGAIVEQLGQAAEQIP
jgi:lysophospholipase L1-like esterase